MPEFELPERASLEYLKKLAKQRLAELRTNNPGAKLAAAQLAVARDHGFASWRKLKAEVELRGSNSVVEFFAACGSGNVEAVRELLKPEPALARMSHPDARQKGATGLHAAARRGHGDVVRALLEYGANVNARDGNGAYALHWAAGNTDIETATALLDAGGDVHGAGDCYGLDVIGWAALPGPQHRDDFRRRAALTSLLLERGARHHIYSAICTGDTGVVRHVVRTEAGALQRRLVGLEGGASPVFWAIERREYGVLALLIELGADIEVRNENGLTALTEALLNGNIETVALLRAAGANEPVHATVAETHARVPDMERSVSRVLPMISVPDIAATLDWYKAVGFTEIGRYWENGTLNWATMTFGGARIMLMLGPQQPRHARDVKLWFYTNNIDAVYELFKARQMEIAHAVVRGECERSELMRFDREIYDPPYGGREFGVRDLNRYLLYFVQVTGVPS